jgi:hypothetical protein
MEIPTKVECSRVQDIPMSLKRLSARQKRVEQWSKAVANGDVRESLRVTFVDTLRRYKTHLAKCWESEEVSEEESALIADLERQLETLESESRLRAS